MKTMKIITYILAAVLILASCAKDDITGPVIVNNQIVLSFSSLKTKAASKSHEAYVSHADIIIYACDASGKPQEWKHSERVSLLGTDNAVLQAKRSDFSVDATYYVQVIANSSEDASFFNNISYSDLLNAKQRDENVLFTGIDLNGVAPKYFLMDGVAVLKSAESSEGAKAVVLNNGVASDNTELKVTLARAAAKIEIVVKAGSTDEFELTFTENLEHTDNPSYYVRNLPVETFVLDHEPTTSTDLLTTSNTRTANMTFGQKEVNLVVYAYSHNWHNQSVLDKEPCVIANLPFVYNDKVANEVHEHPNSWYKIPMSADYQFDRNMYYRVEITVNRAGATTMLDPYYVKDVSYEVIAWEEVPINVGANANNVNYLQLNTDHVDMYNVNTDDSSLQFYSSSPIAGIELLEAYYMNSVDKPVNVENAYPSAYRGIGAVAEADVLSGKITINSPFVGATPEQDSHSNAIRQMTFRVTNQMGQFVDFTVNQYPTIYITNERGYYSYRDDFRGTNYENQGNISGADWDESQPTDWDYSSSSSSSVFFGSKVVTAGPASNGTYTISYTYWSGSTRRTSNTQTFNNPRIYHVHVTATSPDYVIGNPRLDQDGFTDSSLENSKLVAPSFMIASQLGAVNGPRGGWGGTIVELPGGINQARSHCEQYVEVTQDGKVYDDWRLPTAAEIDIIISHQDDSGAMAEVLSGSQYYCAYNGLDNNGNIIYTKVVPGKNSGSSHVRCVRNAY